jgi:hypothetical protein
MGFHLSEKPGSPHKPKHLECGDLSPLCFSGATRAPVEFDYAKTSTDKKVVTGNRTLKKNLVSIGFRKSAKGAKHSPGRSDQPSAGLLPNPRSG